MIVVRTVGLGAAAWSVSQWKTQIKQDGIDTYRMVIRAREANEDRGKTTKLLTQDERNMFEALFALDSSAFGPRYYKAMSELGGKTPAEPDTSKWGRTTVSDIVANVSLNVDPVGMDLDTFLEATGIRSDASTGTDAEVDYTLPAGVSVVSPEALPYLSTTVSEMPDGSLVVGPDVSVYIPWYQRTGVLAFGGVALVAAALLLTRSSR